MTSSTDIQLKSSEAGDTPQDRPFIHALSALLLMVVDGLWTVADWAAMAWVITIPLSFLAVFVPTFLVQKMINKDTSGRAATVAMLLGVLAAVPTPIMGTAVGAFLLAVSGLRGLWKRT